MDGLSSLRPVSRDNQTILTEYTFDQAEAFQVLTVIGRFDELMEFQSYIGLLIAFGVAGATPVFESIS